MNQCIHCQSPFEVTQEDRAFYDRVALESNGKRYPMPEPTACPSCRSQLRMSFRNERSLYHRKCGKTGKQMVTMFHPDSPYVVYDQEEWWKDDWDPLSYGQDFDSSRSFFEQYQELRLKVPRMSLNCIGNENSTYTNYALRNKDCYLIYTADYNEKCVYGRMAIKDYNCFDFDVMDNSRFCHECTDVYNCEECFYCQKCEGCSDIAYSYNLRNCHHCMFSMNLSNKEYHIFNEKVSKEEYDQKKKQIFSSYKVFQAAREKAQKIFLRYPRRYLENISTENCLGNYIKNSKNAYLCWDSRNLEDCRYCSYLIESRDCQDWDFVGAQSQLCYQMVSSAYHMNHCLFTMNSWDVNSDLTYCDLMLGCEHCFGCVGLRKKKYCILNKQYSKEEYIQMAGQIVEHIKKTGEWGRYYPASMSPFAYNESIAQMHFPLTKKDALTAGWAWRDEIDKKGYKGPVYEIPDKIADVKDNITEHVLLCETSRKPYRIIPQELQFYRKFNLPIPHRCPDQRHQDRIALRNPRKLYDSTCGKCGTKIQTSYAPERPEIVYCEKCYLKEVY